jgi:homoserine dehydrogenase
MEAGLSCAAALAEAQARGIAEADPEQAVEGLDAATKLAVLVNALMDGDLRPAEVERRGMARIGAAELAAARSGGGQIRLVAWAKRQDGGVSAGVGPELLPAGDPLSGAGTRGNALQLETDLLGTLAIIQPEPGLEKTAYGLYADLAEVLWRIGRGPAGQLAPEPSSAGAVLERRPR